MTGRVVVCAAFWLALGSPAITFAQSDAPAEAPEARSENDAATRSEDDATTRSDGEEDAAPEAVGDSQPSDAAAASPIVPVATPGGRALDVITVTAERRETNVQETPIAVSVFDMQMLDTSGIQDVEGLSFSVPNFHYGEVLGAASITIRGIATSGGDQATAVHIDGIYQDNPYTVSGISFYDLERVEVLRGPQGTLYGRNATGGTVNVITKAPSFEFEAEGDAQAGSYHEIRLRSVLNVPLVEDLLAVRLSSVFNRRYGYTENLYTGVHNDDLDDDRSWAVRSQVRLQPTDSMDWTTRFTFVRDRSNGLAVKIDGDYPDTVPLLPLPPPLDERDIYYYAPHPNPSDPRKVYFDTKTKNDRDLYMASSRFTWFLDEIDLLGEPTLTVQAGFQKSVQEGIGDADLSDAYSIGLPGGEFEGPWQMLFAELDGDLSELVVEANLDVHTELEPDWMSLRWMLGAFYLQTSSELDTYTEANFELGFDGSNPPRPVLGQTSDNAHSRARAKSAAAFANVDWILWDELTVFGGLRYSWDWKQGKIRAPQVDFTLSDYGLTVECIVAELDEKTSKSWNGLTGRLGAEWGYAEDRMLYGQFSTGYKAGALGLPVGADGCERTEVADADPEQVYAWELGSKNQFFEKKLQLNVTGFAYLYEDIQVTTLVEASLVTQNAKSARVLGAELEMVALPLADLTPSLVTIDTLTLTFLLGYTHSEFTDYDNGCLVEEPSTCQSLVSEWPPPPGPQNWTGNQLPRAPEYTLTLMAQYDQDLGRFGTLTPFLRFFHSDELYFRAANRKRDLQKSYEFLDASLTWVDTSGRFTVEGFVHNIFDVDVVSTKLISSPLVGSPTVSTYHPPRTWGVRAGFVW